jgi:hypothetical protein
MDLTEVPYGYPKNQLFLVESCLRRRLWITSWATIRHVLQVRGDYEIPVLLCIGLELSLVVQSIDTVCSSRVGGARRNDRHVLLGDLSTCVDSISMIDRLPVSSNCALLKGLSFHHHDRDHPFAPSPPCVQCT